MDSLRAQGTCRREGSWLLRLNAPLHRTNAPKQCAVSNTAKATPAFSSRMQNDRGNTAAKRASDLAAVTAGSNAEISKDCADTSLSSPRYRGKKAVVVGAGPAGATAAVYLARQGFSVKVFDARGNLRMMSVSENEKSYCIKLVSSTADVLRDIRVQLPNEKHKTVNSVHSFHGATAVLNDGTVRRMALPSDWFLGPRSGIVKSILDAIAADHSKDIEMHFHHKCEEVSFTAKEVKFEDRHGSRFSETYDLLVAADGANSVIRKHLEEFDQGFKVHVTPNLSRYITVNCRKTPEEDQNLFAKSLDVGWIRFCALQWSDTVKEVNRGEMFIFKLPDGTVQIRPSGPAKMFNDMKQFGLQWTKELLPNGFPEQWSEEIHKAVSSVTPSALPSVVHVPRFYGPSLILLGDAGHGMSTMSGMGCNLAIGDCKALKEALRIADGDIDLAIKTFNDLRYKEAQSFLMLEEVRQFFIGCRCLGSRRFQGTSRYLLQRRGRSLVWRMFVQAHMMMRALAARVFEGWRSPIIGISSREVNAQELVAIIKRDGIILLCLAVAIFLVALKNMIHFIGTKLPIL